MSTPQPFEDTYLPQAGVGEDQCLTFILAGEEYGLDILRVQEIRGWEKATPLPNTPDYVRGVINLRGTIVPVVDLRRRFNLDTLEYGPTTVVIVLRVFGRDKNRIVGIIVDAVSEVYQISADDLQPPPDFGEPASIDHIQGLAAISEKMVIVLDIDRLFHAEAFEKSETSSPSVQHLSQEG